MEAELSGSTIFNTNQEDLLKSAKAKMGEVKEENERLKKLLSQIMKEYQSLENQISSMVQSKNDQSTETNSSISNNNNSIKEYNYDDNQVSLTLGNWSTTNKKHNYDHNYKKQENNDRKIEGELELGLDYCKASDDDPMKDLRFENSNGESNRDSKEGVNMEAWSSSHDLKAKENLNSKEGDDQESLHQPQVKKTRVCIRSRCDSPTIHDGCHWRKYGQKIAKGNPCPRAYYRCTVSQNCPVRKQVQRCPQDMSILITTYEGTHNHPLPLSATAMASATSAAAAMIKSPSLTSQTPTLTRPLNTSSLGLHSSNFITTFNNNPSLISTSSHNSHPTITLDLTLPNSGFSSFDWLSSSSNSSRNSSFLNFSSTPSSSSLPSLDFSKNNNSCSFPTNTSSWANGYLLPYNNTINNSTTINNNNIKNNNIFQNPNSSLNDTLAAAATKVIASNPNFQSVLAAAISSYVGNKNNNLEQKNGSQPIDQGDKSLTLFPPTSKNNASVGADASRGESRSGSA